MPSLLRPGSRAGPFHPHDERPGSDSTASCKVRGAPPRMRGAVFSVEQREAARDRVLDMAASDPRVVAGAVVGSFALGGGDRWSDLDLTFAVAEGVPVGDVVADWTRRMVVDLDAVVLFDLPSGDTIYRVFLLPGCLQVDLSFTPEPRFGAAGPKFRLLFGEAHK